MSSANPIQQLMDLDVRKLPVPTCYVRTQFMGTDGFKELPTNVSEEQWEPIPTWRPDAYTAAIALALELHYENHEVRTRTWVETWVTPGDAE